MKIFLVEDDAALRAALEELLHREGYEVQKAANFREARGGLDANIDLVMLDVGLPDGDGVNLCKLWRSEGVQTPILFLTAKDEELDIVRGLDAGGNDAGQTLEMTQLYRTVEDGPVSRNVKTVQVSGEVLMTGSNRFPIPEVLPGEAISVSVPMTVLSNAAIRVHALNFKLSYQVCGTDKTWEETFTVPVTQAIRLEHGDIQLPPAIAGEMGDLTLPLMNLGKGELNNVLVKLEAPAANPQSVLVGSIAPGETKQAQLTFTAFADHVGTHSGTVTISCEDAYGNLFVESMEATLTVDEPLPAIPEEFPEKEKSNPATIFLGILCVLLIAGLIAQHLILTGKIHKLEEDRL